MRAPGVWSVLLRKASPALVYSSFVLIMPLNVPLATGRITCRHFLLQVDFTCKISDLSIGSTERSEWRVNICLNSSVPGSEASKGFISLPSVCLSTIKIIGVQPGGNATNVNQHIPRISAALVHNSALCRTGLVTGWKCTFETEICAFLFCMRRKAVSEHQ